MKSAALGFRVSESVFSLISLSVMAADRTQGWSGDSFDCYKEYRSLFVSMFEKATLKVIDLVWLTYDFVSEELLVLTKLNLFVSLFQFLCA